MSCLDIFIASHQIKVKIHRIVVIAVDVQPHELFYQEWLAIRARLPSLELGNS